ADTYTVRVYDIDSTPNCSEVKTIDILDAVRPNFTATPVNSICSGSDSGIIRIVTNDNGILPVTYTITPVAGTWNAATNSFEGLPPNTYSVVGRGANECTTTVTNLVITEFNPIVVPTPVVNEFGCTTANNTNNATITIPNSGANLIAGGSGNYVRIVFTDTKGTPATGDDEIVQDGTSLIFTSTEKAGSSYLITVYDDAGCTGTATATIAPFAELTAVNIVVNKEIDCATGEDITVTYTSTNPIVAPATITYTVSRAGGGFTPQTNGTGVFTNLPTGTYTVAVTNTGTGCVLETSHLVDDAPTFNLNINKLSNVTCLGSNTGSLSFEFASATPYIGNYDYEVFLSNGTSAGITGNDVSGLTTVTGLAAGTYYVRLTMDDSPFCPVQSTEITIDAPATALTVSTDTTLISCVGPNTGEVVITAAGGWGSYQYRLEKVGNATPIQDFGNNRTITGLDAGDYIASVQDANGCIVTDNFTLSDPTPIVATHSVVTNMCNGQALATITVDTVTGGQGTPPTYTYVLVYPDGTESANQSSNQFTDLSEGTYSVIIYDGYSCRGNINDIIITDPTKVIATAAITSGITCTAPQATIEVTGAGGSGVYEFSNDGTNWQTSNTFNAGAGQHQFYVRDNRLCVSESTVVTVDPLVPLTATLNVISGFITCNGDTNGVLSATAQGGLGNYQYELLDAAGTVVQPIQSDNTFTNIGAGTYRIRVTSRDCTFETSEHTLTEPDALQLRYTSTPISCNGSRDATITLDAEGGTGNYVYRISTEPIKFQRDPVFRGIAPGTYQLRVQDENGCFEDIEVSIIEPPLLEASVGTITQQVCISNPSPTFTLDIQGGTAPYFTSINGGPFVQDKVSFGAADGIQHGTTYVILVRDDRGCTTTPVVVSLDRAVDLQLAVETTYECSGEAVVTATVADEYKDEVVYTIYGATSGSNDTGIFRNVTPGQGYRIEVTHVPSNCESISNSFDVDDVRPLEMTIDDSQKNLLIANVSEGIPPYEFSVDGGDFGPENEFTILETRDYTITARDSRGCEITLTVRGVYVSIEIPNYFTPDGDGENDYWYPTEVESYHELEVFIYDRYGRQLANFKGNQQGWDGLYEGKPLPTGDYWYTLYYKELSGQRKKLMGHFTLYR
ncbi:hypothetical protein WH52_02720, partial [Tenacibaculum holothuriorum]